MSTEDALTTSFNQGKSLKSSYLHLMSVTTLPSTQYSSFFYTSSSHFTATSTSLISTTRQNDLEDPENTVSGHNAFAMVLIVLILMIIIVGTIVGNILVCVAVCLVRKLRRPYNYLLVSLAVSDLCVAILVMPIALLHELLGEWQFGKMACDLWVSFDLLSCTASILNLCMISVDRYLAITKPLEYGVKRTPKRMVAYILFVWIGAAFISVPPVLILGNEHGDGSICQVCQNFWYQICATFGSFYIPLTVMVTVYYKIFQAAKRIVNEEKKAQVHLRLVEEQGKSSLLMKPAPVAYNSAKGPSTMQGNQTDSRRSSVVQINNGEVETKLAPIAPNIEEAPSLKGTSWISNNAAGKQQPQQQQQQLPLLLPQQNHHNQQHLHQQINTVTDTETAASIKRQKNGNQLLEVPRDDSYHYGSISPMSTITTCESNWSLIPCADDRIESASASRLPQRGEPEAVNSPHIERNDTNATFHCGDDSKGDCEALGQREGGGEGVDSGGRSAESETSSSETQHPENSDRRDLPDQPGKVYTKDSFTFKQNSYTKLPTTESQPQSTENKVPTQAPKEDDTSTEALLNKTESNHKKHERRKSSGGNSPKRRHHPPKSKLRITLAKERKASTTLGIIMSAFIICWLPFFVLAIVRPFLVVSAIPNSVSSLFLWLGYANSLLNPIIYATLNKDFRKPFQEILCLRCSSLNILMREEFYYSQYGPETPNHSHIRSSAIGKDHLDAAPVSTAIDPYEEMTESRF